MTLLAGAREWWAQIIQVMPNLPRIRWTSSTPICPISIHLSEVTEETDNLTSVRAGFATVVIRERWGTAGAAPQARRCRHDAVVVGRVHNAIDVAFAVPAELRRRLDQPDNYKSAEGAKA